MVMSRNRQKGDRGTTPPTHSLVFSARIGENKYKQGPSLGLWTVENSKVLLRGSAKEDRLADLVGFLEKVEEKGYVLAVSLFKNTLKEEVEPEEPEPEEPAEEAHEDKHSDNSWDL